MEQLQGWHSMSCQELSTHCGQMGSVGILIFLQPEEPWQCQSLLVSPECILIPSASGQHKFPVQVLPSAQQVPHAASPCPVQLLILLENQFVPQVFEDRLYSRMLLSVVTFQECCLKKFLTNTTEWRGVGVNNPHCSLEWAGGTGSGFWLNDLSSLSPLPPDLPLLDHTWWQACQTQLVWCGIVLCLSIWKQLPLKHQNLSIS